MSQYIMASSPSGSDESPRFNATPSTDVSPVALRKNENGHAENQPMATNTNADDSKSDISSNPGSEDYATIADNSSGVAVPGDNGVLQNCVARLSNLSLNSFHDFPAASDFRYPNIHAKTVHEVPEAYRDRVFDSAPDGTFLTSFVAVYGKIREVDEVMAGKLLKSINDLESIIEVHKDRSRPQVMYFAFWDVRDAWASVQYIRHLCTIFSLDKKSLTAECKRWDLWNDGRVKTTNTMPLLQDSKTLTSLSDGQVLIQVQQLSQSNNGQDAKNLQASHVALLFLDRFPGGINVFVARGFQPAHDTHMYHVAMNVHTVVDEIVGMFEQNIQGTMVHYGGNDFVVHVTHYDLYIEQPPSPGPTVTADRLLSFRRRWWGNGNDDQVSDSIVSVANALQPPGLVGPMASSNWTYNPISPYSGPSNGPAYSWGNQGYPGHRGGRNHVDLAAIKAGHDVRTTLMLRNIPNGWTHDHLKELLDVKLNFLGLYDFLYLRVDFATGYNVGYAFINIVSPHLVEAFIQGFRGKLFPNSEKIAEVSYATNQGVEALMDKFRNSAVMEREEAYRPKLYYTYPHPDAGQVKPFPAPDNYIKLHRSEANAQHIGLFGPRRPHLAEGIRGRRGLFDRGHPDGRADELEYENRVLRNLVANIRPGYFH